MARVLAIQTLAREPLEDCIRIKEQLTPVLDVVFRILGMSPHRNLPPIRCAYRHEALCSMAQFG